jgi:hypothetical protein
MLKVMFTLLVLASASMAQTSSDGSFSVHHSKHADFSLSPAQMREAEKLYQSACLVVNRDIRIGGGGLRPHFKVIIGTDRNEVHGSDHSAVGNADRIEAHRGAEIWMTKWDPNVFAQGVVVIAFLDEVLTPDLITQLGSRAVRYSNATVDVARLK